MNEIPMNINDRVKVKLTDTGHDILRMRREELNERILERGGKGFGPYEPKEDEDGYTEFQLWVLMETFGHVMNFQYKMPFTPEIILLPPNKK